MQRQRDSAKTRLVAGGRQRARRQPRTRLALVVAAGSHVVRRIGVEERGEVLDLSTANAELEHASAVKPYSAVRAVVVEVEQLMNEAEARRLHVQRAGLESEAFDVGDRVDRRVPGDPVPMGPQ